MDWPEAVIAQFNADAAEHLVRFTERIDGSVKHEEKWIKLSKTRFQWLGELSADAPANPTYTNAPRGEDAVGYGVRVFWPGMARWYQGKIENYNNTTKKHTVKYRDGDVQDVMLKHEAVVYLNKTPLSARPSKPRLAGNKTSASGQKRPRPSSAENGKKRPGDSGGIKKRKNSISGHASRAHAHDDDDDDDYDDDDEGTEESSALGSDDDDEEEEDLEEDGSGAEESEDDDDEDPVDARKVRGHGGQKKTNRKSNKTPRKLSAANKKQGMTVVSDHGNPTGVPARKRGRPPGSVSGRKSFRGGMGRGGFASRGTNPRINTADDEVIRAAGSVVVGARVAIFWNEDSYYKGKLIQFDSYHKRHKILYDDGEEEWVALSREYFRYLTPKTRSAGCDGTFRQAMAQLGADQSMGRVAAGGDGKAAVIHSLAGSAAPHGEPTSQETPAADSAPGWRVSIRSAGDEKWYAGEILSYSKQKNRHLVLYDDGEDEWTYLADEEIVYHTAAMEDKAGIFPGKQFNVDAPSGRDAIGWRVSVYWPGDAAFYPGEIAGYDENTKRHEISYDDGEEGAITIGEDRVKWILPPGVAVDHENLERLEVGGGRPRRRITVGGGDSDPDYEFEHLYAGGGGGPAYGSGHRGSRGRSGSYGGRGRPSKAVLAAAAAVGGVDPYRQSYQDHTIPGNAPAQNLSYTHRHHHNHHHVSPSPFSSHNHQQLHYNDAHHYHGMRTSLVPPPPPAGLLPSLHSLAQIRTNDFVGDPVVVRTITRVPSFAVLHGSGSGETTLPAAVTVRIYLSGSSSSSAEEGLPTSTKARERSSKDEVQESDAGRIKDGNQLKDGVADETDAAAASAAKKKEENNDATSDSSSKKENENHDATKHIVKNGREQKRSPAALLQKRLDALDQMARRIGRAQQAIIKGVPIDLPTQIVRSLRTGPPVSLRMQPHGISPRAEQDHERSVFGNSASPPPGARISFLQASRRLSGRRYQVHHQQHRHSLDADEESETEMEDKSRHRPPGRAKGHHHGDYDYDYGDDDNDDDNDGDIEEEEEGGTRDIDADEDDSDDELLFKSSMRVKHRAASSPSSSLSSGEEEDDDDEQHGGYDDGPSYGDEENDDGMNNEEYGMSSPRSPTIPRGGKIKPGYEENAAMPSQEQGVVDIGADRKDDDGMQHEPVVQMFGLE